MEVEYTDGKIETFNDGKSYNLDDEDFVEITDESDDVIVLINKQLIKRIKW